MPFVTFFVANAALIGMATLRVTFSHAPQTTDPRSLTDALNPSNYGLAGPGTNYVVRCAGVDGDPDSIDCSLGAPLKPGKWTLTASNIKDSVGFETVSTP